MMADRESRGARSGFRVLVAKVAPAHLLTGAAALAAFVLVLAVLSQQAATREVLVAAVQLPAGSRLTAEAVGTVEVPLAPGLDPLLPSDYPIVGAVIAHGVPAGVPLRPDDLVQPDGGRNERSQQLLSIPVEPGRAVGGQLRPLDRVDLISVDEGVARLVAAGLPVVDLPPDDGRPFSGGGPWYVVVEVDSDQALAVAAAIDAGAVQLARSAVGGQ